MVVVGKSNKPHAFKNIDLPVHYYGQKSAWMTKDLFKKWFDECFVPEVRKWLKDHNFSQKALLLLDNAPGHPSEEELTTNDKCITAMFLPPNCTALIQPMDQHIIQFVKQDYKKNLLLKAVSKGQPIENTLKEFNMKDLVFALCQLWNALPSSTITSSWKELWPDIVANPTNDQQISVPSELIEQIAAKTQISPENLETWCREMDKEENIFYEMSDEEIIKEISTPINQEDDDEVIATTPPVKAQDAMNAFELGLQWAVENGASYNELLLLRRLSDKALFSRFNNVKQKKN
ncbi:jerky protein homolog-like [Bactrocera oleae]|uniref:jerky protein homolog-like n=1 Tax=Bactrocera oleae TaxID=104688 RepID=UPI00387E2885